MTTDRIIQIQEATAYPESASVQQALLQVWNECGQELTAEREKSKKLVEALEKISELNLSYNGTPLIGGIDTLIKQSLTEYKKQ